MPGQIKREIKIVARKQAPNAMAQVLGYVHKQSQIQVVMPLKKA
jgi:hypothetical protein